MNVPDTGLLARTASFIQHSLPGLDAGRYAVQVAQTLAEDGGALPGGLPTLTRRFGVAGPRYALTRAAIHSVFPPENGAGEFSTALPHVVLEMEELPWLRSPFLPTDVPQPEIREYTTLVNGTETTITYDDDRPAWMAVLLVSPSDLGGADPAGAVEQGTVLDLVPASLTMTVGDRPAAGTLPPNGYSLFSYLLAPGRNTVEPLDPGVGQSASDPVAWLDLPCTLFDTIVPSLDDLAMMAHVRAVRMEGKPVAAGETVSPETRYALVMGSRLPESLPEVPVAGPAPGANVAFLVSLEALEHALRGHVAGGDYDAVAAQKDGFVRLPVLHQWRFTSREDTSFAFETLLKSLNGRDPSEQNDTEVVATPSLRLPAPAAPATGEDAYAPVRALLDSGYLPLQHATRVQAAAGGPVQTVSWYRGPLVPYGAYVPALQIFSSAGPGTIQPLVYAADQLLRFDPVMGMFDASYAAAWQLGRLLALRNRDFSVALYRWKQGVAMQCRVLLERQVLAGWYGELVAGPPASPATHAAGPELRAGLLRRLAGVMGDPPRPPTALGAAAAVPPAGVVAAALADTVLPGDLVDWLARLRVLQGVPFRHLVPDARLLPPESIRFFQVDPSWMAALVDGALSPGRSYGAAESGLTSSLAAERVHRVRLDAQGAAAAPGVRRAQVGEPPLATGGTGEVTGFLLRSRVVDAWKSMDVAGYPAGASPYDVEQGRISGDGVTPLGLLRLERLGAGVLLGLFAGPLYQLVLHQPPEAIHSGFLTIDPVHGSVTRNLRIPSTSWDDPATRFGSLPSQVFGGVFTDGAPRVLDLAALSRALAAALHAVNAAPGYYRPAPDAADAGPGYYHAAPDPNYKDHLLSSDFALEMVEGVGLVSFVNDVLPGTHSA